MSIREDLAADVAETVGMFNGKVQETLTLGRPADSASYAEGLAHATAAFDLLDADAEED